MKKEDKIAKKKKNQKENHKTAYMVHDKVITQTILIKRKRERMLQIKVKKKNNKKLKC